MESWVVIISKCPLIFGDAGLVSMVQYFSLFGQKSQMSYQIISKKNDFFMVM